LGIALTIIAGFGLEYWFKGRATAIIRPSGV
jgi:hypothetical protein